MCFFNIIITTAAFPPSKNNLNLWTIIQKTLRYLYRTFLIIYILYRQMYTVLCYLTQFILNAAQHVSSLYNAHLQGLFRWNYNSCIIGI
jgi:hypothetical protein